MQHWTLCLPGDTLCVCCRNMNRLETHCMSRETLCVRHNVHLETQGLCGDTM